MILISDILYFASVDEKLHSIVREIYEKDPKAFAMGSSLLFDIEQRNILHNLVGEPVVEELNQQEINTAVDSLCTIMHEQLSPEGRDYLHVRGIDNEQINRYKFGDNAILLSDFDEVFYHVKQSSNASDQVITLLIECTSQYHSAITERYESAQCISLPSYRNNNLTGVVFRTVAFEKREKQLRNMFKFYSPYNYSYMFNEDALDKFDTINVVEGVADALALIRLGYENTVSPSMVRLSPAHIQKLQGKALNVLFDQDMGGLSGIQYILERIPEQVVVAALTPNARDFDEEDPQVIHNYMKNLAEFDIRKHM